MIGGEHELGDPAEWAALYLTGAHEDSERAAFEEHLTAGCARAITSCVSWNPFSTHSRGSVPP